MRNIRILDGECVDLAGLVRSSDETEKMPIGPRLYTERQNGIEWLSDTSQAVGGLWVYYEVDLDGV